MPVATSGYVGADTVRVAKSNRSVMLMRVFMIGMVLGARFEFFSKLVSGCGVLTMMGCFGGLVLNRGLCCFEELETLELDCDILICPFAGKFYTLFYLYIDNISLHQSIVENQKEYRRMIAFSKDLIVIGGEDKASLEIYRRWRRSSSEPKSIRSVAPFIYFVL